MCAECGCHDEVTKQGAGVPAEGEMVSIEVGDVRVAVAMVEGTLHAFDDTCTHRQCLLSGGDLEGLSVVCPCHEGRFDITTGEVLDGPPPAPIRVYPVSVDGGALRVDVSTATAT